MKSSKIELSQNPYEKAGFLSKLLYFWTIPLFKRAYDKELQLEDIFKPLETDRSEFLGNKLEKYVI